MIRDKSHYSLAEAADLAKCKTSDLLHFAVQRKIILLVGVPDWVDLRVFDEAANADFESFLMVPQLLVLKHSFCLKIEINGRTQQSDFPEGYFIESSGKLKKIRPSYGHRELNPEFLHWRTYRDKLVTLLELVPESLFVTHANLAQFLEPDVKPEAEATEQATSKPTKSKKPDVDEVPPQPVTTETSTTDAASTISAGESDQIDTRLPGLVDEKQLSIQAKEPAEPPVKGNVLLRLKQVMARTGLSRSTIYNKLDQGCRYHDPSFPKQVKIGVDTVGWIESEIQTWIDCRISASRSNTECREEKIG